MKPTEVKEMMQKLRNGQEVLCPQCHEGRIKTPYNPETGKFFKCSNDECDFTINCD